MQNNLTRHVGKIANTDQRCVVALMSIPGREDHALVIPTDSLPPKYEQAVMEVLQSQEGQASRDLASVLHRRLMPDNGKTVLASLHEGRMLFPVPVANVLMLPKPNMPFRLADILRDMELLQGGGTAVAQPITSATDLPPINPVPGQTPYTAQPLGPPPEVFPQPPYMDPGAETPRFNPHLHNQQVAATDENHGIARNLLLEALMLENEAEAKRARAYAYAPGLRPPAETAAPGPVVAAETANLTPLEQVPAQSSPTATKPRAKRGAAKKAAAIEASHG